VITNFFNRCARADAPVPGRPQRLLLGWPKEHAGGATSSGAERAARPSSCNPVTYEGDAPLISCAPTGSGKGRGVLIPNLLTYPGSVIVLDIKGELFQVTNRRRREMGQKVIVLDPFRLVTDRGHCLNPLDLLTLPRADIDSDSEMLASMLTVASFSSDPFWTIAANGITAGLIAHVASGSAHERHLGHLRRWLYHDDMDLAIARLLDQNAIRSRMARDQMVGYLAAPSDRTRPSIRATACSNVTVLGSELVVHALASSSFRLLDLFEGKPLSIYIVIPPDKLDSHKALLRLWTCTLLTTVMRRTVMPRQRTLFLLDECAQLGEMPILRQAITLLRGSGLQTWTFWQDLSQLRHLYPDWETIVNNSGVLQVFGISNHHMAKEWIDLLGPGSEALGKLSHEDAVVRRHEYGAITCRRLDYLKDPMFAGLFDANPRFALQGQSRM
jgi:type IV secretion system protein VirD4